MLVCQNAVCIWCMSAFSAITALCIAGCYALKTRQQAAAYVQQPFVLGRRVLRKPYWKGHPSHIPAAIQRWDLKAAAQDYVLQQPTDEFIVAPTKDLRLEIDVLPDMVYKMEKAMFAAADELGRPAGLKFCLIKEDWMLTEHKALCPKGAD